MGPQFAIVENGLVFECNKEESKIRGKEVNV
jgi:hypothetical protein